MEGTRPGAPRRTYGRARLFLATCHLTKQRSLDRGVGQTGTLGSRCGGLRPALTSCPHGPVQQVGGLLRWRKCDVHTHQTCPEALLPALPPLCLGLRQHPSEHRPDRWAEDAVSAWRREGAGRGQVRWPLCCSVAGQVLGAEVSALGGGRRTLCGAGRRGCVPRGARSPDSSCTLPSPPVTPH